MPHKRNPVLTENLTGLARLVRMAVVPAMENVALWHERDISHSSVERMIGPDATVTLDFALARLTGVIDRLRGLSRDHAAQHEPVPRPDPLAARAAGADPEGRQPRGRLRAGPAQRDEGLGSRAPTSRPSSSPTRRCARRSPRRRSPALFDLGYHTKHVDTIFARVFGAV